MKGCFIENNSRVMIVKQTKIVSPFCFTETPVLTNNRRRACLTLGALARSLHDKNLTKSDYIVDRIEHWLDYHNESTTCICVI